MSEEEEQLELFDVFRIGDTTFPNHLNEHIDVRSQHINECFMDHPQLFAWYATAFELALDKEGRAKEELARTYARLDHMHRTNGKAAGVKMTEKMVENTVITDPLYTKTHGEYLDAKRNTGLLKAAKEAMIHRRDMLIQMGATYRAEGLSDISLKEQQYKQGK
jgi:hypothetical protein